MARLLVLGVTLVLGSLLGCDGGGPIAGDGAGDGSDGGRGGKADDLDDGAGDPAPGQPRLVEAIDISHWTRTITDPEVDCFWAHDVRHVIAGTQVLPVTRQQLEVALRGGMTVDVYVYLYWDQDLAAQVQEAVELAAAYPIERIWLDIEEPPHGRGFAELRGLIDQAIAATDGVPFGIYTGKGWWQTWFSDSELYADVPLWYARYDGSPDLAEWQDPAQKESFGGWTTPVGKQYDDHIPGLCGLAVDDNVMWVGAVPEVAVDRTVPPDDGTPPDAPVALLPDGGVAIRTEYVKPTAPPIREATGYQLELQVWGGAAWQPYWSPRRATSDLLVFPTLKDRSYRFRMRGENGHGDGPWSAWAWFDFGVPATRPAADQIQL